VGRFVRTGVYITPIHRADHQIIQDSFVIDARGMFLVAGFVPGVITETVGVRRAVLGGKGEFANARGEAVIEPLSNRAADAFRISFEIQWWEKIRTYVGRVFVRLQPVKGFRVA
jgi:hypothetical protein